MMAVAFAMQRLLWPSASASASSDWHNIHSAASLPTDSARLDGQYTTTPLLVPQTHPRQNHVLPSRDSVS